MATKILILGESGVGKTRSIKNLDPKETALISVIGKEVPMPGFRKHYKEGQGGNWFKQRKGENSLKYDEVVGLMMAISERRPEIKTVIVDDIQYIMSYEFLDRCDEKSFDKFVQIARHMFDVLITPERMRDDITVVFLAHSEDVSGNGQTKTKMKTIGKMLDDKITIEGLFSVVLLAGAYKSEDGMKHVFLTNSDGTTTAKSPEGMFTSLSIPNDLKVVIESMKAYQNG